MVDQFGVGNDWLGRKCNPIRQYTDVGQTVAIQVSQMYWIQHGYAKVIPIHGYSLLLPGLSTTGNLWYPPLFPSS